VSISGIELRDLCDSRRYAGLRRSRRDVLRVWAAAAVALVAPSGALAEKEDSLARQAGDARGGMLGFSTYGMPSLPTEQAIGTLREIGYDAIEIAILAGRDADSATLDGKRRRALRARLADSPLCLTSLMEDVPPIDDRRQTVARERLKMAAGVAHDLSPDAPPLIQTVLGGGEWASARTRLRDCLAEWITIADETDTTIAIKPHRSGAMSQPADAVWLIDQLGRPARLRMVYDYSHYAFRDLPLEETIRIALPFTAQVALKDAARQNGKIVFQLPGEAGTIDYGALIGQFYRGGYRGDFNCEVSGMVSSRPGYDPLASAKFCYTKMAEAFREAGVERASRPRSG
jgi:inosose dehydratase